MLKYSFVIPVYKVEKYLDQCVESIVCQTYQDFEIILVDDGSPDSCPRMCDAWVQKDQRIKVVHKQNEGLSVARNTGVLYAAGEYIIFVDSDDYWNDENGLRKINDLFKADVDIVVFSSMNYYEVDGTTDADRYNYPDEMNGLEPKDSLQYMIEHDLFNPHAAKKAFRKQYLLDNHLFYKKGIRAEDIEMYIRAVNCLPTVRFLNEKLYVYRHRSGSITSTVDGIHLSEHLSTIEGFIDYSFCDEDVKKWIYSYLAYSLCIVLAHVQFIKPENSKELTERIKKCCFLFEYTSYPRTKLISHFYRVFGFTATKLFLGWYLGRRWKK